MLNMDTLIIATRNVHKTEEIRSILGNGFRYLTLEQLPAAPPVEENANTFAGNATKKAVELARWLGSGSTAPSDLARAARRFVLADDSGLEVDALNGAPGVHSARFAGLETGKTGNSPDTENNARLLHLLKEVPWEKRDARFRCALALTPVLASEPGNSSATCFADELELQTELFEGVCEGKIGFAAKGAGGFGYDPLFVPEGCEKTFAELGEEVKNRMSHRARALRKLEERLAGLRQRRP
jgi:XTP/dITP diphosphohydrolase